MRIPWYPWMSGRFDILPAPSSTRPPKLRKPAETSRSQASEKSIASLYWWGENHGKHICKYTYHIYIYTYIIYTYIYIIGNFRILKWRVLYRFSGHICGDIQFHSPYIGLVYVGTSNLGSRNSHWNKEGKTRYYIDVNKNINRTPTLPIFDTPKKNQRQQCVLTQSGQLFCWSLVLLKSGWTRHFVELMFGMGQNCPKFGT
jgi:hypothetical protein